MKADTIIRNGKIVNVYTGEILEGDVAVRGEWIDYVGDAAHLEGPDTLVEDARGDYVLPGFFDAHAHMDLFYNPLAYAECVLARGTTGVFNDGHDLASGVGVDSYLDIFDRLQKGPMIILSGAPAALPPFPDVEGHECWSQADFEKTLEKPYIVSLSEIVAYMKIVKRDADLLERFRYAQGLGKRIEGHTTGANWDRLSAVAREGVLSCHESLNSQDVLNRLRLGFTVMLRHGSIRHDMESYMEAIRAVQGFDTSRLILVTDGIFADQLLEWGNMDWVVSEAVRCGLDPIRAIQMATINPARYFGIDSTAGAIAPGKFANILIAPSLKRPTPRKVFGKGLPVAEEGELLVRPYPPPGETATSRPFRIHDLHKDIFRIAARGGAEPVPVITIVDRTVTRREDVTIPSEDGFYSPPEDVLLAFLISRDGKRVGRGFLKGFARGLGGLAATVAHDTHGLQVVGSDPADMAMAADDALREGGGVSLVQGGRVRARIPLPMGGVCSMKSVPEVAEEIKTLNREVRACGSDLENPLFTLAFLTSTAVLYIRLTYKGVFDLRSGKIIF